MSDVGPLLVVLALVCGGLIWYFRRVREFVSRWARANGVTVVAMHWAFAGRSPWPFAWLGHQTVRYLSVRDRDGHTHRVWLLLGHFFWGLTERVTAVWES